MIGDLPGYGAELQTSPQPLVVIGYYYCEWPHGCRKELYRRVVTHDQYRRVVRQINKLGRTNKEKDRDLFFAFKPTTPPSEES